MAHRQKPEPQMAAIDQPYLIDSWMWQSTRPVPRQRVRLPRAIVKANAASLQELLDLFAHQTPRVLDAACCVIAQAVDGDVKVVAARPAAYLSNAPVLAAEARVAWKRRAPHTVLHMAGPWPDHSPTDHIQVWLNVPILTGTIAWGTLTAGFRTAPALSRHLTLLATIAGHLNTAIIRTTGD